MIVNQINVIYVNFCLCECFSKILTCMIEFRAFGIDWGLNKSFDRGSMVENCIFFSRF